MNYPFNKYITLVNLRENSNRKDPIYVYNIPYTSYLYYTFNTNL